MATFSHFPTFFSLSSHKLSNFPPYSLTIHHHHRPQCRQFAIRASSTKKPRADRKVRSNDELCKDIRDFVSLVGLPEDHVPSMKEFTQHGRQDLANIVRRRGYKFIGELLSTSTRIIVEGFNTEEATIVEGFNIEEGSTGKLDATDIAELGQQDNKVTDLTEDISLSQEVPSNHLLGDDDRSTMVELSTDASLQEKVANFIQNGELDEVEGSAFGNLTENDAKEDKPFANMKNLTNFDSSVSDDQVFDRGHADMTMNGSTLTSKLYEFPASRSDSPKDELFVIGPSSVEDEEDLDNEARMKNQAEINHLKLMLHQKELELSQLKEQIEKEKLALSLMQTKAETEISKAQRLVSEKDAELHAAEESLFGLKEVQIKYCGDGETVEVTGSFNGWHHRVKMEPQPSSSNVDPIGTRNSKLWMAVFWLYPGTYEIKFIVDGEWRIDPLKESVAKGAIQNNILRVDR